MNTTTTKENTCPRCLEQTMHDVEVENALSRVDNETYICSDCGTEEALIDAGLWNYLDVKKATTRAMRFSEELENN